MIIRQLWYYGDIISFTTVEEIISNPETNLKQWARDLQVMAGISSNMTEPNDSVEISEFSDFEDEDEDEDEGEGEGVDEEIPYTEDWEAPPSDTPSDSEDEDIPDDLGCIICHRGRRATVQFASCSHAACNSCLKGIYRSRRRADGHFPTWFPCHSCRAETSCVGELSLQPGLFGTEVQSRVHHGQSYTIWNWVPVRRWVAKRSTAVARGLRDKAILGEQVRTDCDT